MPEVETRLTDYLSTEVAARIRQRGRAYMLAGAVARFEADDQGIRALVTGTRSYTVNVRYDPIEKADGDRGVIVRAGCDCPYFDREDVCKHVWATLLSVEKAGGKGMPTVRPDEDAWIILKPDPQLPLVAPESTGTEDDPSIWRIRTHFADTPHLGHAPQRAKRRQRPRDDGTRARSAAWASALKSVAETMLDPAFAPVADRWPVDRQVLYRLEQGDAEQGDLTVDVMVRQPKRDGGWRRAQSRRITREQARQLPEEADRQIFALVYGVQEETHRAWYDEEDANSRLYLEPAVQQAIVQRMCETGRCVRPSEDDDAETEVPVSWLGGESWSLHLALEHGPRSQYVLRGVLRRGEERMPVNEPTLLTAGGLMLTDEGVSVFEHHGAYAWVALLREEGELPVPAKQAEAMLEQLLAMPSLPPLELPEELAVEREQGKAQPYLRIYRPDPEEMPGTPSRDLHAVLSFRYGETTVGFLDPVAAVYSAEKRELIDRDRQQEAAAWGTLREVGFRDPHGWINAADMVIGPRRLRQAVTALVRDGWLVEAEGELHRPTGSIAMDMRGSGIDWFELHGEATFDNETASLPELLKALKRGENFVQLGDGSFGLLPEDWLERYAPLARLSGKHEGEDGRVRLQATQIGLVEALLTMMPEVAFDEQVARAREKLEAFERIEPREEPREFNGELRPYQRDGLAWLHFLRELGFGGCLADDMGLGKTVQVLALLEARRQERRRDEQATPPSLVVAPRSLIHNWQDEAKRFTPDLRVLNHTGRERFLINGEAENTADPVAHFADYDLILTTYGTLRRDIATMKDHRFDYVVLDESQMIKNAATASAKATRLLQASHRLALSGTPIENHVGELFNLFDFLNPGMLGEAASWFGRTGGSRADAINVSQANLLARAVGPFVLRRTKQQVATDLPEKVEQTLPCDLPPKQRKLYDELREYYGAQVMGQVQRSGMNRSKMQVLQALLRLRQAACHPGLIDKTRSGDPSAKLDMLLPQLEEVLEEGHKALVFSQFTSFLKIVRDRLDAKGIEYAYLDGRTRKRGEQVERFQTDPDCKLFLISLKAGGTGLNLTAADYVFLLDPWWNPAVEAQAIDRAHRIGQVKRVFAYRLIASDTVEEKVLELQQSKRDIADAIIRADGNLIRNLSVDDLKHLLS
ncbi:MAG: DEAD/DEAH box helicase [Phycisphaeraceae bacterium]